MPKPKAAVARRSDPQETLRREGAIMHARYMGDLDAVVKAAGAYSRKTVAHLRALPPQDQAAFIKGMIAEGDVLFQPWAVEILYVLGLLSRSRFTELQRLLGVSSRTLSDKLQALRRAGLVEREVFDEQPVRIEYFLTKRGQRTAVLGAALFADYECLERRNL
jgi:DNA-binding HxlR family transcriptional regulator